MRKILALYTGGTIGMNYREGGLTVVPGLFESQVKLVNSLSDIKIDLIEYDEIIDSSDIELRHWVRMITDITNYYDQYDGFVIVHGTDTMAFTSSMLAFALQGLTKPVILTGSQLPLVHRRSDGWTNLADAVYSAMQSDLQEVAIAFNHKLFRGVRAQKVSANEFVGFDSVDEEPLATFGIKASWHKKIWFKPSNTEFMPIIPKAFKILNLSFCPGFTTDFIADTLNNTSCDAVILQAYGSGTIPMHDTNLVNAIKSAVARGVIIVAITQVIEGRVSDKYMNSQLNKLGVLSGYDMTVEATLAKLTILFSSGMDKEQIKETIGKNLVGELTEVED